MIEEIRNNFGGIVGGAGGGVVSVSQTPSSPFSFLTEMWLNELVISAIIGAIVGYVTTLLCKWAWRKIKYKFNKYL